MVKKKFVIVLLISSLIAIFWLANFLWQKNKLSPKISQFSKPVFFKKPALVSSSPASIPTVIPRLTLDLIFSKNHLWAKKLPKNKTITIITTGDIIPARSVNYKMTQYNDFTHPFAKTADFLKSADITLINLESPLVKDCPVVNTGMKFCGNQRFINGLKFAGIDIANLANNHALNWGVKGIQQTISLLEKNHILTCGYPINNLTINKKANTNVGFLGWNLLEKFNEEKILSQIKKAKKKVNVLIISVHWGTEYVSQPALWQKKLAHKMIKAGADLIIGNHPHWIQPIEIYQGKLIIYAHGNFIFDQEWSQETKTGVLAKHTFYQNKLVDSQFFPIFISDYNQADFLTEKEKNKTLNYLKSISLQLKTSSF